MPSRTDRGLAQLAVNLVGTVVRRCRAQNLIRATSIGKHMRTLISTIAFATGAALLPASTAFAGGVGVTMGAGFHQDQAYYYRDDGEQGIDKQMPSNSGIGVEVMLGDRDDRVLGIVRGYVARDGALTNPDPIALGEDPAYTYIYPDVEAAGGRSMGAAAVGIQWGLWGDPTGFQVIANTLIGSQFWTKDNLEAAFFQPGVGVTYTINERFQFMGALEGTARFRKHFRYGADMWVSARYMFD